jgi:hypothetical protein
MAVNGVIDFDNTLSGDMTCSNTSAGAWWQVDLGGQYNVSTVTIFNRYLPGSTALNNRLSGATVQLLNAFGEVIGMQVLSGNAVQTYTIATFAPSASPTATTSGSQTASASRTSTSTASVTASTTATLTASPTSSSTPSASLSFGASATSTNSVTRTVTSSATTTSTGSQTPSSTSTPTPTQTPSPSFSPYPWFLSSYMYGSTYTFPAYDTYTYSVQPWGQINQLTNGGSEVALMGSFVTWQTVADASCPTGARLVSMFYAGGAACSGGYNGERSVYVNVTCGNGFTQADTAYGSTVTQSPTCTYWMSLQVRRSGGLCGCRVKN